MGHSAALSTRRTARLDIRVDDAVKAFLAEAAALARVSLSAFVVDAARERATALLGERRSVVLDDSAFDAFVAALDVPTDNPALRKLFAQPSPFRSR